jgi:Flp pilus assembly pilin Flp
MRRAVRHVACYFRDTLRRLIRNCRGAAQIESALLLAVLALAGLAGQGALGRGFASSIAGNGAVAHVAHGSTDGAGNAAGSPGAKGAARGGSHGAFVTAKQAGLGSTARGAVEIGKELSLVEGASKSAALVSESSELVRKKRLFPNTRFVAELDLNTGVVPGLNMGVGFVRENNPAIGKNGVYGMFAGSWLVGAVKKYKSPRPELNQGKGVFTKELGMFTFGDTIYGTKTYMEVPVPLATWTPAGIIPGIGAAEHMGRPGMLVQIQIPFTFVPIVGETIARAINAIIPEAMPFGKQLRKLVSVTAMRVGIIVAVYNPRLQGVVKVANSAARWLDPKLHRLGAGFTKARRWVFSSPSVWKERITSLHLPGRR